jgi:DnaJ-class molecular chaperone
MTTSKTLTTCTRCCGTGIVGNFANVKGGVCFKCNGTGKQAKLKTVTVDGYVVRTIQNTGLRRDTLAEAQALAARMPGSVIVAKQYTKRVKV